MMDGRVGAIRAALMLLGTKMCNMAYAAKYSSGFYGPSVMLFRLSIGWYDEKSTIKWILEMEMKRCMNHSGYCRGG